MRVWEFFILLDGNERVFKEAGLVLIFEMSMLFFKYMLHLIKYKKFPRNPFYNDNEFNRFFLGAVLNVFGK